MATLFIVFGSICLAILAGAGLAWVLNLFGVIGLDPSQKKILDRAFGVGLVGGLATAGAAYFTLPKDGPARASPGPPVAEEEVQPSSERIAGPPSETPEGPVDPSPDPEGPPTPVQPQPATCKPAAHPEFLAEWAAAALGTPPTFRCAIAAPYPPCVAELREKPLADIAREAALACGADLLAFRKKHIASAYSAKLGYQDNLDAAEASLRNPRNPEEQAQLAYVSNELGRMNGPLWTDFIALDRRSSADMQLCQLNASRCLPPG
jgi:hypothetical protein